MWCRVYCDPGREWNPPLLRSTDGVEEVALDIDSLGKSLFCHPEPCPESSNVILNLFQDQGLRISGSCLFLDLLDAESSSA
jgi:hypothetical protein